MSIKSTSIEKKQTLENDAIERNDHMNILEKLK